MTSFSSCVPSPFNYEGLGNIVSQTSPNNTNSGSNSGFATGGSGTSRGEHHRNAAVSSLPSPPETHHNLSPPQPFTSAASVAATQFATENMTASLLPSSAPLLQFPQGSGGPSAPINMKTDQHLSHLPKVESVRTPPATSNQCSEQVLPPPTLASHSIPPSQQQQQQATPVAPLLAPVTASTTTTTLIADVQQQQQQVRSLPQMLPLKSEGSVEAATANLQASSAPILGGHRMNQNESKHNLTSTSKPPTAATLALGNTATTTLPTTMNSNVLPPGGALNVIGNPVMMTESTEDTGTRGGGGGGWQTTTHTAATVKTHDGDSQSGLVDHTDIDGGKKHKVRIHLRKNIHDLTTFI